MDDGDIAMLAFFGATGAFMIARWFRRDTAIEFAGETYRDQDDFLARFGKSIGLEGTALGPRHDIDSVAFSGTLPGGRTAQLTFHDGEPCVSRARLPIDSAPRLTITLETWRTRLAKAIGSMEEIEIGVRRFDDRYLLETDAPLEAARKLAKSELRAAIDRAFDFFGVTHLEIGGGYLAAVAPTTTVEVAGIATGRSGWGSLETDPHGSARGHRALLEHLDRIARLVDRRPLQVTVLGGERFAFLGQGGKPRCPYCRVDLTGTELDLVACDRCSTVLHGPCWEELGRCPVLGCPGTSPERAPGVRGRD